MCIFTVQYSTVQYSTVQYSTVQYSTVQYSTVQYSKVQYMNMNMNMGAPMQLFSVGKKVFDKRLGEIELGGGGSSEKTNCLQKFCPT